MFIKQVERDGTIIWTARGDEGLILGIGRESDGMPTLVTGDAVVANSNGKASQGTMGFLCEIKDPKNGPEVLKVLWKNDLVGTNVNFADIDIRATTGANINRRNWQRAIYA